MKGFGEIIFLIIALTIVSVIAYFAFLDYQRFRGTHYAVFSLSEIDSSFDNLLSYSPQNPTAIYPVMSLKNGTVTYQSPFSPCTVLINDRSWEIFSKQKNMFPTYRSIMLFDRFWRVVWLGLKPQKQESQDYTFYGPFRLDDLPERSFVEYILVGRDVRDEGGQFTISLTREDCIGKEYVNIDKTL